MKKRIRVGLVVAMVAGISFAGTGPSKAEKLCLDLRTVGLGLPTVCLPVL